MNNFKDKKIEDTVTYTSKNVIHQMVDSIVGKERENPTERDKEIRRQLSGRACEYLMFMDDDD